MEINTNFDEFIQNFYHNFPNFILRVRDQNDIEGKEKNSSQNIAYYNGIKAFIVNKTKKGMVKIDIPFNVYKCNVTDIRSIANNEKKINKYKRRLKKLIENISPFFPLCMDFISFEKNENSSQIEQFEKQKDLFCQFVLSRHYTCTYTDNRFVFTPAILDVDSIVEIEYQYIKLFKGKSDEETITKNDTFHLKKIKSENKEKNFEDFICCIKKGIERYTGGEKKEKKYQHYFMLQANQTNLFDISDGEWVEHFEQEYGIMNKKMGKEKKGRIDCIFVKYKKQKAQYLVKDIYLIELKVDDDVILKDNGVMTHMDDISAFLRYEDKEKPKGYDVSTLKKRIQNRNRLLYSVETKFEKTVRMHFYTIVAFSDLSKENIDKVKNHIKGLCYAEQVKRWCNKKYANKIGKNDGESLLKEFEGKDLYVVAPYSSECTIRFFFDQTLFNLKQKKIGKKFVDMTKELTPGFMIDLQ